MEILKSQRIEIDRIDDEIMHLLGKRYDIVREVAKIKHANNLPAILPDRVEEVKDRNAETGKKYNLNPEFIKDLFQSMIDEACRMEDKIMEKINDNK